jgi:predicted secreted protein
MNTLLHALVATLGAVALTSSAIAQGVAPPPVNVVSLSASATVELARDWLTVVFSTTREAADAATVQSQLKQALDAALAEARKGAKPGQLELQTGAFSLNPRYAPPKPGSGLGASISGWQGSTELIVEGRDTQAIAQLTSRITTLAIARVGFSLSREARERVEADVAAQAIARFRARAEAVSKQFGMGGHVIREVSVLAGDPGPGMVQPMLRAQASRAMADESLPVEAGKAQVTATVSGSIQMTK